MLLLFFTCLFQFALAQQAPRGMKYQAVARDLKGEILADARIDLRINLLSKKAEKPTVYYSETHAVETNKLGLFTLVIGEGKSENGGYDNIPWSSEDIWMEIQIKPNGQSAFTSISNSQLLAVPYAYYAATAGEIAGKILGHHDDNATAKGTDPARCPCEGGLSQIVVLYNGPNGATVKVWGKKDRKDPLVTFNAVNSGAILTVNANNSPGGKFKNETFFEVVGSPIEEINTECEELKEPWEMSLGETFGNFSVLSHRDRKNNAECTVCDLSRDWHVGGNGLMDLCNWFGTKSYTDLVFITNNIERLKITKDGDIDINANLQIGNNLTINNNVDIGNDLTVRNNVFLNTLGGSTINNGAFSVTHMSPTALSGILNVDKNTWLKSKLFVDDEASLKNKLFVDGDAWLKSKLLVDNEATLKNKLFVDGDTWLKSILKVDGITNLNSTLNVNNAAATNLSGALVVDGISTFKDFLSVTKNSPDFVARFINNNTGDGDGIQIKLSKNHPAWNGSSYLNVTSPGSEIFQTAIDQVRAWMFNPSSFQTQQIINLFPASTIAGTTCNLLNIVIDKLNSSLPLPFHFPATHISNSVEIFPGISFGELGSIPALVVPAIDIPGFELIPALPTINCGTLPSLSVPHFTYTSVANSLTNENQFISFVDKDDRELGSVRAQSVDDWTAFNLSGDYLVNLMAGLVGIDLLNGLANAVAGFTNMAYLYNTIGVEYASGHADYAEWLERSDPNEIISAGDIVGVKGGKITRDLANAEQILPVSHNPIVLGNAPKKDREAFGNKIAFTGQVPVKVIGAVNMGDYIVARSKMKGYGIAINPGNLTTDDMRLTVGRSWETNLNEGPKMVNTLIGIDNGDYIRIMKDGQEKIASLELRMQALEEKMNNIRAVKQKKKRK